MSNQTVVLLKPRQPPSESPAPPEPKFGLLKNSELPFPTTATCRDTKLIASVGCMAFFFLSVDRKLDAVGLTKTPNMGGMTNVDDYWRIYSGRGVVRCVQYNAHQLPVAICAI